MNFDFDKAAKANPYTVPQGYFAQQESAIYAAVDRYRFRRRLSRISVAASIAVVAILTATFGFNHSRNLSAEEHLNLYISEASDNTVSYAADYADAIADAEMLFATDEIGF